MKVRLTTQSGSEYVISIESGHWEKNGHEYPTLLKRVGFATTANLMPKLLHPQADYSTVANHLDDLEHVDWEQAIGRSVHLSDQKFDGWSWWTTPVTKVEFL